EASIVRAFELRMAATGDGLGVIAGVERQRDRRLAVAAGLDERGVEVGGCAVGLDAENAVARRRQIVASGQFERARVARGDVLVTARTDAFVHTSHRRNRRL